MFHHVVLMKFSAAADTAFFDRVEGFCERIRACAPNLQRYVFKANLSARRDGLDWAIVSSFDSSNDHDEYQASPLHQEMKTFMTPFIDRIVVCDVDEV
jgi:predicted GNAT superfamily acetyltransferase